MSLIVNKSEEICKIKSETKAFYYIRNNELKSKSYSELYEDVQLMSSYLIHKGVNKGDRILAFATSNYNLCIFILASFKIGASVMYVNVFAKQESLKRIFEKYRPQHILVSNKTKMVKMFFKEINKIKNIINIDQIDSFKYKEFEEIETEEDTPALITVTTGSTGNPKMFIRTHKDLYNQLLLVTNNINKKEEQEIVLTTSYIYIFANIMQGFTTVLPNINLGSNSDSKISKILNKFKDLDISMIITSPDFCLRTPNIYPNLKTLYFGGAILNYNEAERIRKKYRNSNIIYIYGSTECNLISGIELNKYIEYLEKDNICVLGNICNGVELKIDEENHILVKSDALLTKTLEDIEIDNEYYDTNDIGKIKDDMLIYIGKNKFFIEINNNKIYCNEIEQNVILEFKQLQKCAIIQKNEKYYLFIEDYKVDSEEVKKYIKDKYSIETNIIRMKIIPRDNKHHTKIDYIKLEKILEEK